jgi:Icc-related predicted phosphoesterase
MSEKNRKESSSEQRIPKKKAILCIIVIMPIPLFFIITGIDFLTMPIEKKPWVSWFDDPQQKVYVSWETEDATKGIVFYGTDPDNLIDNVTETSSVTLHHVNITSLTADTKYYYRVEIKSQEFGSGVFKTAPIAYDPFTFAMISDTQRTLGPGHFWKTAAILGEKDYAFVANAGDMVDDGRDKMEFNYFFHVSSVYLDTVPIIPVMGNHDYRKPSLFHDYFINTVDASKQQFRYSFNWSSVHFQIAHFPYGRESETTDAQLNWMKQDLANAQSMPFRIVFFHCPVIGSSFFGRSEALLSKVRPILESYNVTAVIHGHEHHFERGFFTPGGVMFMIIGGGGAALDAGLRPQPETEILTTTPSYTEVHATATTLNFKTITTAGDVLDDYTITEGG